MSEIRGIKVGKTNITSTYTSKDDTKEFTVTPVSLGTIATPANTVYTGSAITPTPTVTAVVDGVSTTLEFGTDYTLSYSNNTNVGTATVTATGIGNFEGTVSSTWQITGATITVTANDQSFTYDGSYHGSSVTVSTVNDQPYEVKYRTTSSGEYNLTSAPQFKNVVNSGYLGTVYFQVTADNHQTYTGSYQLVIYPKVATLSWGQTTWMFDGSPHTVTCTVSNLETGDTCTVTLDNPTRTAIGTQTVEAIGLSNSNYTLTGATDLTRDLIISAALFVKLSGTWTPVKGVYKKIGGSWIEQDMTSAFSTAERYKKMN